LLEIRRTKGWEARKINGARCLSLYSLGSKKNNNIINNSGFGGETNG
jgi:hypothetical protein